MAIQELSKQEINEVSGGAGLVSGLLNTVTGLISGLPIVGPILGGLVGMLTGLLGNLPIIGGLLTGL